MFLFNFAAAEKKCKAGSGHSCNQTPVIQAPLSSSVSVVFFNLIHLPTVIMNIFVANLSYRYHEESLRELFETYGEVESARIITDKATGRSKGFGFVEMKNDDEAEEAIRQLNEQEVEGRKLVVKASEEKPQNPRFTNRRPPRQDRY
jgi:RNA recognition motif-containing protein